MEGGRTIKQYCRTDVKKALASLEWTISNFDVIHLYSSDFLESSTFPSASGLTRKWKLRLFPCGKDVEDYVSLYAVCQEWQGLSVSCDMCIVDSDGKESCKNTLNCKMTSDLCGFRNFVRINELNSLLLPDNCLTVRCFLTVIQLSNVPRAEVGILPTSATSCNKLSQDLEKLLSDECFSDVVLLVGDKRIPAHKSILSARSEYFRAMFSHEMKENQTNEVPIQDAREPVVREMLRFVYSGRIADELPVEMIMDLLKAADKYCMLDLKDHCSEFLRKSVSAGNVVALAVLADSCCTAGLKTECIDFICTHGIEILNIYGATHFSDLPPSFFGSVIEEMLKRNDSSRISVATQNQWYILPH